MTPDILASFCAASFASLSWGMFGMLVGVGALLLLLLAVSSVAKGRRRRGTAVAVFCLALIFAAMTVLLRETRSRRYVRFDVPSNVVRPAGRLHVPVPPPSAPTAIADEQKHSAQAATAGRGQVTVAIDHGQGTLAVTSPKTHRLPRFLRKFSPRLVWSAITACAIGALMFVGYIALDAGTRGHFTWLLRVLSVVCFGAIITTVVALRHAR